MRLKTFIVGYIVAVAVFLFAQRHNAASAPSVFGTPIDLTHIINGKIPAYEPEQNSAFRMKTVATVAKDSYFAREFSMPEHYGTHIDAPAHFIAGLWTVDQIPTERLLAPLVVLDVESKAKQTADYQVSPDDVADWEKAHGQIPQGAVVVTRTGWESRWNSPSEYRNADSKGTLHFPGYSPDAARFLVEGRNVIGLGIDTLSIDYGPSKDFAVHKYTLSHSLYHLENVANLQQVPASGAIVVVAPIKLEGGSGGPVRILALVK
jgi:kynurenine formamidase